MYINSIEITPDSTCWFLLDDPPSLPLPPPLLPHPFH